MSLAHQKGVFRGNYPYKEEAQMQPGVLQRHLPMSTLTLHSVGQKTHEVSPNEALMLSPSRVLL